MDNPLAPRDISLKNIIDKLAEFVARNGPEFEQMTKIKQKGNPKFSFLYNGEYHNYYLQKVATERSVLGHSQQSQQIQTPINNIQPPIMQVWNNQQAHPNPAITAQLDALKAQQNTLREQITVSEQNLQAQHGVLLAQQQAQIEEAIARAQVDYMSRMAHENNVNLIELDQILQPIVEQCTKDSISNGKSWILQHTTDSSKCQIISQYLLKKAMVVGGAFSQKLHLIYLINDLLHHCVRKNAEDLKKCLEAVVIPAFCNAKMSANDEQSEKLSKLLALWESKANFFDSCAISKLLSPPSSLQEYKNSLRTQHASVITPLTLATKATFDNYQQQHQAFIQHAHNQIAILDQQKQQIEQQNKAPEIPQLMSGNMLLNPNQPSIRNDRNNQNDRNDRNDNNQLGGSGMFSQQQSNNNYSDRGPPPQQPYMNLPDTSQPSTQMRADFSLPPPILPDLSRPPPGFGAGSISPPNMEQHEEDLTPSLPYFELPAGLIVPLIRLEDYKYHALDSEMIRLPPPTPPNERLLSAVEAFYSAPSHERPRDGEGWEKLALYEYFKVKNAAKKQKEEEITKGTRERSKSPTPIPEELCKKPVKKTKKRIYRSKSRSNSRSRSRSLSPDNRPTLDRSRRRSKTPPRMQQTNSPPRRVFNREHKNEITRRERSITPPSFSLGAANKNAANEFIQESNKGHQMLMKMGWRSGTGLGSQGQGIDAPIQGAKVRDQNSKFQGIGLNAADPYENFRKSRGQAFITRMKARSGEERS